MTIDFTLGIPQLILCALYTWSLGMHAVKHGELRDGTYNFWYCLIGTVIVIAILKWGGFF